MKLMNTRKFGDFHLHSSTLSDGLNTIDEIVIQAGRIEYQEITITDHCQYYMESYGFGKKTHYSIIDAGRWQNIHNHVEVNFGVEGDLLNEKGDVCMDIQGFIPDFVILSAHKNVYNGSETMIRQGYLNAIQRYGSRINFLGHLCARAFEDHLHREDIIEITRCANQNDIALELNCANLKNNKTNLENLEAMLSCAKSLYVNSDAHTLHELKTLRQSGFEYLKQKGYLKNKS